MCRRMCSMIIFIALVVKEIFYMPNQGSQNMSQIRGVNVLYSINETTYEDVLVFLLTLY